MEKVTELTKLLTDTLSSLDLDEKIDSINYVRSQIHRISPFFDEPVDCIHWVKAESVEANDYNPNSVAPPEMELLKTSILHDGYTQPIVAWPIESGYEVIDGFHRNRVGKESTEIRERVKGYLPIAVIKEEKSGRNDRIASTIRHNRARGKHRVDSMSDIVVELKRRNWSNDRISRELGMDQDEILRLCQITGLSELFTDQEFSKSWDIEGEITEEDFIELTDDIESYGDDIKDFRTVNTSDENRIFHVYEKWECFKAGFYENTKAGMTKKECEEAYKEFLSDISLFSSTLEKVINEWKHSCEHYLTNAAMNRIAWLGQAAACYELGIPSAFRSGYYLLNSEQQKLADETALIYLNKWLSENGRDNVSLNEAYSGERQSDIY